MTSKPLYNALAALLYIVFIAILFNVGSHWGSEAKDNILMPIGMLSLFVLSASIMAYIFFYQPVILFLDGKRSEAVNLFLRTVAIFAGITAVVLASSVVVGMILK